jgi:hypothetical protein
MFDESVTVEFLSRQFRRVLDEIGALRDEVHVQGAILLRLESAQSAMAEQLRSMVSQHRRFNDRLRALEEEPR